jgi:hypothetical protein
MSNHPTASVDLLSEYRTVEVVPRSTAVSIIAVVSTTIAALWSVSFADITQNKSEAGSLGGRVLQPLIDANGVAFQDGNGGAFHIF